MILFFWLNACVVILHCVTNYYIAIFIGMGTMKGVEDTEGEGEIPWWWEEGEEEEEERKKKKKGQGP
jgi:hypothetical protein